MSIDRRLWAAAWDEALARDRPCVLEAITDPDVPPLPPHITLEQAAKFASTLFKGDPMKAASFASRFGNSPRA